MPNAGGDGCGDLVVGVPLLAEDTPPQMPCACCSDTRRLRVRMNRQMNRQRQAQGIVTLTGTVPSREAKRRAEALAERVGGVRDVHNTLAIAGL